MDVFEAVDSRIACRHFLDKPVDLGIVRELIMRAQRAASGGNLQSWNVYALANDPRHMKSEYPIYPDPMFGAYKERRDAHGVQLYGSLGIAQTDGPRRLNQFKKNFEFFNAPVALFITIDRRLGPGQWADLGGYINSLAVLARGYGLDTCPQEAWARLYDTIGEFLNIPPHEMLFCGVAIGYGDRKHKANDFRSPRAELSEFCKFHGFE
jgi:nitroreductase